MKRVAAVAIINDHHMLMGKRRDNQRWTNPGGHLNEGEDPLAGAVREVKEETGLELDSHLFKHLETRIVKKPDGTKIEVHGFRVDLPAKPSTSMKEDPDAEVFRWRWIKLDTDLDHIKDHLHVPLGDNVLLDNILKDKPMKRHVRKFWQAARRMGVGDELQDKFFKEGPQQYIEHKKRKEKTAEDLVAGGKADNKPDSSFPKDQIRKGMKVEREHTTNPQLAKEIAKDHLTENRKYYDHLKTMETNIDKKAFWVGFEKQARGGLSALEPAGFLHPANILNALGATTSASKKDSRETAEATAKLVASDKHIRKNDLFEYLINPAIPGPFTEVADRLTRRHHASRAEHPVRSALIPFYGMIRGGKAGKPKD